MFIGGLQKNSLIDYPGKVSCVLFLSGCNFDCPYCHNPELANSSFPCFLSENNTSENKINENKISENKINDFLERRKGFLDGVVISGGEPTIQKDLVSLCEKIKRMDYPVKLDTNGSRPQVIKKLINRGLVDYVAMDIKTDPYSYSPLIQKDCNADDIISSIRIIMESTIPYEFKTTCIKPLVDINVIKNILNLIKGSMLYALQRFNNTGVLHPEFFRKNNRICNDDEIMYFKSVARQWVKKCIVR